MRRSLMFGVLASAACASGSSAVVERTSERAVYTDVDGQVHRTVDVTRAKVVTVAAPPDQTWNAVLAAYRALGIDVLLQEPSKGQLGNGHFARIGKLAGVQLSEYLDCGGSSFDGPRADSYRVTLSLITTLVPEGSGTSLATELTAEARPLSVSGDPVHCVSTQHLEERLAALVQERTDK
jgi:hypothetical protein